MPGHQGVSLYVEDEIVGRPLDPALGEGAIGDRVEAHVCLDQREPRRVVAEPVLGRFRAGGIEHAGRSERPVRPPRGADANVGRADGEPS